MVGEKMKKCCFTCRNRHFGFPLDTSWGACDYTCVIEEDGTAMFLLCTHGMTPLEVAQKLRRMGTQCVRWKNVESDKTA